MKFWIVAIVIYLCWIVIILCRSRKQNQDTLPAIKRQGLGDIMGKTKTVIGQMRSSEDKQGQILKPIDTEATFASESKKSISSVVDKSEFDEVFSQTNTPLEIEVEEVYDQEEEELVSLLGEDNYQLAKGVDYDEMGNLIGVLKNETSKHLLETIAVETLARIENTNLYEQMLSQIEGGLKRASEMLSKHEISSSKKNSETGDSDFKNFDLDNFL